MTIYHFFFFLIFIFWCVHVGGNSDQVCELSSGQYEEMDGFNKGELCACLFAPCSLSSSFMIDFRSEN